MKKTTEEKKTFRRTKRLGKKPTLRDLIIFLLALPEEVKDREIHIVDVGRFWGENPWRRRGFRGSYIFMQWRGYT